MATVRSTLRALFVLPAAAGALLLGGCGDPATEPTEPGAPPATRSSEPAPVTSAAPAPTGSAGVPLPPPPTKVPTASGRPVTVEGIIEEGVEPGCRVLNAGDVRYLLLGGKDAPTGVPVRVEGVLAPGVLSTCQQGTPLRVTDVRRR